MDDSQSGAESVQDDLKHFVKPDSKETTWIYQDYTKDSQETNWKDSH